MIFQFFNRKKLIILMYHGFTDKIYQNGIENYQGKHINIELFRSQISYLKKYYNILSLEECVRYFIEKENFPDKSAVITIDDGYKSNYTLAFPIFKEFDIPATIFLTTDFVDNQKFLWVDRLECALNYTKAKHLEIKVGEEKLYFPLICRKDKMSCDKSLRVKLKSMDYAYIEKIISEIENKLHVKVSELTNVPEIYQPLQWDEILKMTNTTRVSIGNHTQKHLILTRYANKIIKNELMLSKEIIQKKTGINTRLFSYPNGAHGDFNANTKLILKELGYSCALTTVSGMNNKFSDIYELKRFGIGNTDLKTFILTTSGVKNFVSEIKGY